VGWKAGPVTITLEAVRGLLVLLLAILALDLVHRLVTATRRRKP
jgi:hypothetical protein